MNEITKELMEALKTIESWNSHTTAYAVDFGSNGVRDFYRAIARQSIAKAEAALAEPQADEDGWIPWSGGECPIPEGMAFDLRFRDGAKLIAASSDWPTAEWDWSCESGPYGIVAYRIVKESGK